jgi:hypothetical protein
MKRLRTVRLDQKTCIRGVQDIFRDYGKTNFRSSPLRNNLPKFGGVHSQNERRNVTISHRILNNGIMTERFFDQHHERRMRRSVLC